MNKLKYLGFFGFWGFSFFKSYEPILLLGFGFFGFFVGFFNVPMFDRSENVFITFKAASKAFGTGIVIILLGMKLLNFLPQDTTVEFKYWLLEVIICSTIALIALMEQFLFLKYYKEKSLEVK